MQKKKEIKKNVSEVKKAVNRLFDHKTFGQKAADKLTAIAGSWGFILGFMAFLIFWMLINTSWIIFGSVWDPKPFIMLNLILSCLAAFQAPIILMSQNRAGQKDRQRAEYDYKVNRKAERENQKMMKQLDRIERYLHKK